MIYDAQARAQLVTALKIDRDMIDEELIAQAQHFWHVAEAHEQAVSVMDARKLDLETIEVELDKELREQLVADGEKVTEKSVEGAVKRHKEYQDAAQVHLKAKSAAGKWSALREAYRQRRDVLIELSRRSQQRRFDEITGAGETRDARNRFDQRVSNRPRL